MNAEKTNVLLTGASGLLGRAIMTELAAGGFAVTGTAYRRAAADLLWLDLRDTAAIRTCVDEAKPDVIVHSAAERRPDICENEPELTRELNVEATRTLAAAARDAGAWIVYLSTDYVFDGTAPPYRPGDETNPLNRYGRSKRDGENAVIDTTAAAAVLRVPILYGDVETPGESAVTAILEKIVAAGDGELKLDAWATRYPTLTGDVAVVCRQMIEQKRSDPGFNGIFHWSGDEPMTKYDMGMVMAKLAGLPPGGLVPDPTPPDGAPRPRDCRLDCSDLEALGIGRRTPFADAIEGIIH